MPSKKNRLLLPILGSIAVLAVSPVIVLLTGKINLYALILLPLTLLLWALTKLSPKKMGISLGRPRIYIISLLYPALVMGLSGLTAWLAGGIQVKEISAIPVINRVLILFLLYFIGSLLTEEGFFRGWLWGVLERGGFMLRVKLLWTAGLFSLWHYVVTTGISSESRLPMTIVPIYLGNIFLIGLILGLLRQTSGSILVPSVAHGLWNALLYPLFGVGEITGMFTITSPQLFDPERGFLGLGLNLIVFVLLWRYSPRKNDVSQAQAFNE
jgi:membrane protease YdiL (CAAX protease family)